MGQCKHVGDVQPLDCELLPSCAPGSSPVGGCLQFSTELEKVSNASRVF